MSQNRLKTNLVMSIKKLIFSIPLALVVIGCSEKEAVTIEYVTERFNENAANIQRVSYNDHRIDSSVAQNVFWDFKGEALLERNEKDEFFGFSFYGKRDGYEKEYLYDNENGFEISHNSKNYSIEHPYQVIGSPGGQLTVKQIFSLDTIYKTVEVFEKDDRFLLTYTFEPDTTYNVTDQVRIVELRKEYFFPVKVTYRSKMLDKETMNQHTLSNIKINDQVTTSIATKKNEISDYEVIQEANSEDYVNPIINSAFPEMQLPYLTNTNQNFTLESGKITLIDFWEVWCGPCIKSFPKVETLHKKYQNDVQIIGIATEGEESAKKLIAKKGVTFPNLLGTKEVHAAYNVNSFPRYFLIDKKGIVQKEYFGFSEDIENDIKKLISE